jgi:peptidoglycan/xylan/chitin deacetylase (PgdA/CDA1 family)
MPAGIPILLYHSISQEASLRFKKWTVTPELFAAHMAYLYELGYTPITVTKLATAMTNNNLSIPDRAVVITFDDGFADFFTGALPVLKRYGFSATLYIAIGFVGGTSSWLSREAEGNRPMLTWDQIAEISTSGVECGTHSLNHVQLDTVPFSTAYDEISRSKSILEHYLDKQVSSFSYPHGYNCPVVRRLVQQAGFTSACGVKNMMSSMDDDTFALARIIVATDTNVKSFGALLEGRGLRTAPVREHIVTKGWRFVRRSARLSRRRPSIEPGTDCDK